MGIKKEKGVQLPKDNEKKEKKKQADKKIEEPASSQKQVEDNKNEEPENLDSTVFVGNVPLDSTHKSIKKFF